MKIVVISPTFNEKENIKKLIPLMEEKIFPKVKNHNLQLLIVDDNSPDGTAKEIKKFSQKWKNIHLLLGEKEGLGKAYVRGMRYAIKELKADAIIEIDADFQHDPNDIPKLLKAMDDGADHVIGSRYIEGGQIPKEWGIHRKIISRIGGLFAQLVFWRWDIHDMTSGYKLTKSKYINKINLDKLFSYYYAYKLHILHDIIKQKPKIKEVPIIFYERKKGSSKITTKDLIDSFLVVLKLRIIDSKRFIKFLIVGGTGFLVQVITQEGSIFLGLPHSIAIFLSYFTLIKDTPTVAQSIAAGFGAEAAIISNFLFNNFWTFDDTRRLKEKSKFIIRAIKFNLASMGSILIQAAVVFFAVKTFGEHIKILSSQYPTRLVVIIPTIILFVIPLNYIIYNFVIWKTQYLGGKKETTDTTSNL